MSEQQSLAVRRSNSSPSLNAIKIHTISQDYNHNTFPPDIFFMAIGPSMVVGLVFMAWSTRGVDECLELLGLCPIDKRRQALIIITIVCLL